MVENYSKLDFQGYYTDADDLRDTMIQLLGNTSGKSVLEPCFGTGAFLKSLIGTPKCIDAIDIDGKHFSDVSQLPNCRFIHDDFLKLASGVSLQNSTILSQDYDLCICNPPYGLKFSTEFRKSMKKAHPDVYAKESYGLFLYFCLDRLANDGRYVFIIPDTFLYSRLFRYLRRKLVDCGAPSHIIRFKSSRFMTVNYGYSDMCIIAGYKQKLTSDKSTTWIDASSSTELLGNLLANGATQDVSGDFFLKNVDGSWIVDGTGIDGDLLKGFDSLGNIADCKTGIYTGNNKEFCGFNRDTPPSRVNGHPVDWHLVQTELSEDEKVRGFEDPKHQYVKFIRGGHLSPFNETLHCLKWDTNSLDFYKNNKKARLQNKSYYFLKGLAVPMVTSGRLSASIMENAVFDQGVVGVFPRQPELFDALLIYLNSQQASRLKSLIAPGANNSANYLKKLPVPKFSLEDLHRATIIVNESKATSWQHTESQRNSFIEKYFDW